MKNTMLVVGLIACLAPAAGASDTGAAFLKIGVGARPIAMGNAFTAVADDINAIAWNPAGLSLLGQKEVGATHAEMFADTRYDFVGYAQPLKAKDGTDYGTAGFGVQYLTQGAIDGRDANRQATGGFTASDMAVNLAYSRGLGGGLRLGANAKYLSSTIANASARSFAADFGAMARTPLAGLSLGAAVQNVGPGMRFLDETNPLPLTLAGGAGYQVGSSGLLLALDVKNLPSEGRTTVSFGTEYAMFSALSLRAGYLSALAAGATSGGARQTGNLAGFGAGLGVRVGSYKLDYSFTPFGELGNVQRISLGARF